MVFCTCVLCQSLFFFFNDTATTEIYTLSLHDALPIFGLLQLGQQISRADESHEVTPLEHGEGPAAVPEQSSGFGDRRVGRDRRDVTPHNRLNRNGGEGPVDFADREGRRR